MKDKLAEEMKNQALLDNKLDAIIKKRIIVDAANFEYCVKNNVINAFLLAGIRQSMREYAKVYHEAKMKEVTDEDIERWAFKGKDLDELKRPFNRGYTIGLSHGAKAFRDGEIKHNREV